MPFTRTFRSQEVANLLCLLRKYKPYKYTSRTVSMLSRSNPSTFPQIFKMTYHLVYDMGVSVPAGIRTQNQAAKGPPALPLSYRNVL